MMKRILGSILLMFMFISINPMFAQTDTRYEEACDNLQFEANVDALMLEYLNTRQIDESTDASLASLMTLQTNLDTVVQDCLEAQRVEREEELTILLERLYEGGLILYVRHTHTDRIGSGDTDRPNCETERNLSTRGREEAMMMNDFYVLLELPIDKVISTELCRTLDTTELAFGEPDEIIPRNILEDTLADVLKIAPELGENIIIVAHIGTMQRNFGLPIPFDEGDTYIFEPMGEDGTELIGRIALLDWEFLAEIEK